MPPQEPPRDTTQPRQQPQEGLLARAFGALLKDGTLAAGFRQGIDEIGQALKAFPDSIQVQELGTIFSPTPGEISQQRGLYGLNHEQEGRDSLLDRSRTAAPPEPGPDQGNDRPQGRGH